MAPRPRYQRGYSFSGFQANRPKQSLPGQHVDIELDNIADQLSQPITAYEIAVADGFVGTEADYLASLVGAPGKDGSALPVEALVLRGNALGDTISISVAAFGADASGGTSARSKIINALNFAASLHNAAPSRVAVWQGQAPVVFLPPGEYLWDGPAYNPTGVGPILLSARPGTVRIRNTGGDYLFAPSQIVTQTDIRGIHLLGGKGLIHYTLASANVTGFHAFEDNVFDGYTECAIANETADMPTMSVRRNSFLQGGNGYAVGLALGGYCDSTVIEDNQFLRNSIDVKIGDRLSGNIVISRNAFFTFSGGMTKVADIWLVPNSDVNNFGINSGYGTVIRDNKFGNENIDATKPRIIVAQEAAGASRALRQPSTADSAGAYYSGLVIEGGNRFVTGGGTTAPLLRSYISNLRNLQWRGNLVHYGHTYLAQMPASSGTADYAVRNWSIDLLAAPDVGTAFQFGISNVPYGLARDEWGTQQTDPMARLEGPADDAVTSLLVNLTGAGLATVSATLSPTTDIYGGPQAATVTFSSGGGAVANLSTVSPDNITWLELILAPALARPLSAITLRVYSTSTQVTALSRQVNVPTGAKTVRIPFVIPPGSPATSWIALITPTGLAAGSADSVVIHRIRVYHARTPVQSGHVRTLGLGTWNAEHIILGVNHLWVDASGRLRIKTSAPTSDTDGAVVGAQA